MTCPPVTIFERSVHICVGLPGLSSNCGLNFRSLSNFVYFQPSYTSLAYLVSWNSAAVLTSNSCVQVSLVLLFRRVEDRDWWFVFRISFIQVLTRKSAMVTEVSVIFICRLSQMMSYYFKLCHDRSRTHPCDTAVISWREVVKRNHNR